jgi:hypothetical protein
MKENYGHEAVRLQGHTGYPFYIKQYVKLKYCVTIEANTTGPKQTEKDPELRKAIVGMLFFISTLLICIPII